METGFRNFKPIHDQADFRPGLPDHFSIFLYSADPAQGHWQLPDSAQSEKNQFAKHGLGK